ncbi:hypothetical protein [Psychromarinibacter sp. S121]|uniref:hypothetical protein n=1 Tax=Psychromarinibacter sp. S121 TaxID=3415127 RepID=UPI003C7C329F
MGDENLFHTATKEYEHGKIDRNLLAKAKVIAEGDESLIRYKYISLRVEQIKANRKRKVANAALDAGTIIAPAFGSFFAWLLKIVLIAATVVLLAFIVVALIQGY